MFNPNAAALPSSGIFGLSHTEAEAALIYLPVPWEVTTSYGSGTSLGPSAILKASHQVDLYDGDILKPYEAGLCMLPESESVQKWNQEGKRLVQQKKGLNRINQLGEVLNDYVRTETSRWLNQEKIVSVVGGDHSVPFGALQAMGEKYSSFGILHFDAHLDTRNAFEGFYWSHASIMHHVLEKIPQVVALVQVGIRDFCEEELEYCHSQGKRVQIYFDNDLAEQKFKGFLWGKITEQIVSHLPEMVWISFDIDGLDPLFCPNTGTPVPGGLHIQEVYFLMKTLVLSGRKIIGFDLCEVSPSSQLNHEWDANVGARLLYKLSAWTLASQGKASLNHSALMKGYR